MAAYAHVEEAFLNASPNLVGEKFKTDKGSTRTYTGIRASKGILTAYSKGPRAKRPTGIKLANLIDAMGYKNRGLVGLFVNTDPLAFLEAAKKDSEPGRPEPTGNAKDFQNRMNALIEEAKASGIELSGGRTSFRAPPKPKADYSPLRRVVGALLRSRMPDPDGWDVYSEVNQAHSPQEGMRLSVSLEQHRPKTTGYYDEYEVDITIPYTYNRAELLASIQSVVARTEYLLNAPV